MEATLDLGQRLVHHIGRGLLGLYFIIPGITKITGWDGTVAYMQSHEVPLISVTLPLTIVLQIGAGACLLLGYRTQLMAFVLAGLTLVINLYMHDFWNVAEAAQQHETQNFIKNLAIMAGLLFVAGQRTESRATGDT